eukprot:960103-Prymnesium_polylepis.1
MLLSVHDCWCSSSLARRPPGLTVLARLRCVVHDDARVIRGEWGCCFHPHISSLDLSRHSLHRHQVAHQNNIPIVPILVAGSSSQADPLAEDSMDEKSLTKDEQATGRLNDEHDFDRH